MDIRPFCIVNRRFRTRGFFTLLCPLGGLIFGQRALRFAFLTDIGHLIIIGFLPLCFDIPGTGNLCIGFQFFRGIRLADPLAELISCLLATSILYLILPGRFGKLISKCRTIILGLLIGGFPVDFSSIRIKSYFIGLDIPISCQDSVFCDFLIGIRFISEFPCLEIMSFVSRFVIQ